MVKEEREMSRYVDNVVGNFITYSALRLTRCRSFRGLVNIVLKWDDYPVLFEKDCGQNRNERNGKERPIR